MDDGNLLLRVSCRSAAGELTESVPYALAISFEVGVDAGIQVYDQVRARLAPITRTRTPTYRSESLAVPHHPRERTSKYLRLVEQLGR